MSKQVHLLGNEKFSAALNRIESLFINNHPISVAYSGGKDSSLLLDMTLIAAINAKEKGRNPYILVTNGDTGVENPEVSGYLRTESEKIKQYAVDNGITLDYQIARPKLNDMWAVQVISGRKLPTFPQNTASCSVDLKVNPMVSLRKKLMADLKSKVPVTDSPDLFEDGEVITLVGTRISESTVRGNNMAKRNENQFAPTRNQTGDLIFTAIADFDTNDVWEWIGLSRSGLIKSYSDFDDLTRIYADAGNTSCAVVSDVITEGMKAQRGGCGARTGCMICTKVRDDKSLTAMIKSDGDRYGYMEAPSSLRQFIVKTQWDFDRRNWVGKTIKEDKITIRPDTYSPAMCLELLRYALTIDENERVLAREKGISPRFELVPIEALVAIDATWSLQGMHKPFQAVKAYMEIAAGDRFLVPDVDEAVRAPLPAARYIEVKGDYDYTGLRDHLSEMSEGSACMGIKTTKGGKTVLDTEMASSFEVNKEGAFLALEFKFEAMMKIHDESDGVTNLTAGYRWWARMGTINLSPQQVSIHDDILKRTQLKESIGAAGPYVDKDYLLEQYGPGEQISMRL